MEHPVELGRVTRITHRKIAENDVIQCYYCGFQCQRGFKTEVRKEIRYDVERVVSLTSLLKTHQGLGMK